MRKDVCTECSCFMEPIHYNLCEYMDPEKEETILLFIDWCNLLDRAVCVEQERAQDAKRVEAERQCDLELAERERQLERQRAEGYEEIATVRFSG